MTVGINVPFLHWFLWIADECAKSRGGVYLASDRVTNVRFDLSQSFRI